MKFDRTIAHRNDDAAGVATIERRAAGRAAIAPFDFGAGSGSLTQFDRLSAGLLAQREPGQAAADDAAATVDEPTREMPRIVDFGAGRCHGGIARVRVAIRDRGDHAGGFATVGTART